MGKVRQATWKPLVAWSLTGSVLVVLAAALVLLGLNASRLNASRLDAGQIGLYGLLSVGVLAYAGAGGLIARRVPGNAIGWLLGLAGLSLTVAMLTEQYALYGLATAPGAVPAAKVAGVLSAAAVALTVILLFVLVLLFPDGRLPSPRWRPVLWALAVVAAGLVAQQFQVGTMISGGITNALNGPGSPTRTRWGSFRSTAGSAASWQESSSSPSSPACSWWPRCSCGAAARAPNAVSSWPGSATSAR